MQDWHKTDLKLTQKSLDVWISLDFHLGPPKTNFGIKKTMIQGKQDFDPPTRHPTVFKCFFYQLFKQRGKVSKAFSKRL